MSSIKIHDIKNILSKIDQNISKYNIFIESGTFGGETILNLKDEFQLLYTIELSEKYFNLFNDLKIKENYRNIINYFGDTVEILPKILNNLRPTDKSIFWLDGHWSSLDTARGNLDCPLIQECNSIDEIYKSDESIILIDDYRLFGTNYAENWENITEENILKCFKNFNISKYFIYEDIFVLYINK
jgi:hypothetical protein